MPKLAGSIGFQSTVFVGFLIQDGKWNLNPTQYEKFLRLPCPTTKKSLLSWLGLLEYFHKNLPDSYRVTNAFSELRKKSAPATFELTEEIISAFELAKTLIVKAQHNPLAFLDESKEIYVKCDASEIGCGAHMFQLDDNGEPVDLLFTSKLFSPAVRAWSVTRQEALALFHGVFQFRWLLEGHSFSLITDHSNLLYMANSTDKVVMRMYAYLSHFQFEIQHVPRADNACADALSKLGVDSLPTMYTNADLGHDPTLVASVAAIACIA
jgi:hypothetical protein